MAKDTHSKINKLADELGTAESHRRGLVQEVNDLEEELDALNQMAETATTRSEYDAIRARIDECSLDLRFARNRLRSYDQSPRIDKETLTDLLNQLSEEADAAAEVYRQKVEKPLGEIAKAGDAFDATISEIIEAVRRLASMTGPAVIERDGNIRQMFYPFELGKLRSRAYTDNYRTVHPELRDALKLASTAKQPPFRTC